VAKKTSPLADKLDEVKERIASACARAKRDPSEVTLVAVTKTAAPEQIREILQLGVGDLALRHGAGDANRAQENDREENSRRFHISLRS
jgi:uncharacterized pyridoxal phosphate-containing UPF0001 family protein